MVWLLTYFFVSTAYSVYLKKIWAVDTITLAGLYTTRILAGGGGDQRGSVFLAVELFGIRLPGARIPEALR